MTSKSFASRLTYGAMLLEADAHVVVEDVRELGLPEAVDEPRISAVTHDAHPVAGLRHQLENWNVQSLLKVCQLNSSGKFRYP